MTNIAIEYLTDSDGNPKAVVIPIDLWKKLLPQGTDSLGDLAENLEDSCLNKAMDEAQETPLMGREEALQFLKISPKINSDEAIAHQKNSQSKIQNNFGL